ncbi:MAG: acyl-CoA dehydrogenase family protein [Photobacterium frigidiphilum]|uniref:acyl-CoA dehydrogenase family protein n=1 Tax=Photobacterium frigidiphilum TaxID=264736 RepID=UPI00300264B7
MDFELNEDQRAFAETARQFALERLSPMAAEWDEKHIFPKDVLKEAGDLGFLSLYTPEEQGGLALSRLDSSIIFEQLAMGCTSTTAFMTIHNMVTWMIASFATDEAKAEYCPQLITGDWLGSYCLTEPNAGSDAAALTTSAKKVKDQYILNGAKTFISGAGETDVLVVMARTVNDDQDNKNGNEQGSNKKTEHKSGAKGISAFIVPADAAGITYGRKEPKMGWNSQPTRSITFDNVAIPARNLLGQEGEGFTFAMKGLDGGRINIATCSVGTAQQALNQATQYMNERKQFGKNLAQFQGLQFKLADMATELVAARQLVRYAASKLDRQDPEATAYCAMAKRFATDTGFTVCDQALQLYGGYGYIKEYPLERYFRDVRVHQILEGTNEIMRLIIARRLLAEGTEIL